MFKSYVSPMQQEYTHITSIPLGYKQGFWNLSSSHDSTSRHSTSRHSTSRHSTCRHPPSHDSTSHRANVHDSTLHVSTSHDSNSHHLNSHDTREHSTSHDTLEHSTSDDTQQCNSHATSHLPRTVATSTSASSRGAEGESSASVTYGVYGGGDATNEVYAEGDATNGVHGEGTATNGVYGEGNTGVNIRGGSWRWRFRYDVSLLQLYRRYFWNFIGNALVSLTNCILTNCIGMMYHCCNWRDETYGTSSATHWPRKCA